MESHFVLAGITNDETKFHHILALIPEDVAINRPMGIDNYRDTNGHICCIFQKSKQEMIEEALGIISLDGQKPSLCLMRIQRKLAECNLTLHDDVIKHRLMQAMPISVKTALSALLELPFEQFAKLADTIYSYSNTVVATSPPNIFVASSQQMPTRPLYNQHSMQNNQSVNKSKSNRSLENTHRPFTAGQRPKICRYHLYFAEKAKSCKPWCQWPGQKPKNIEPTFCANSLENSPTQTLQRLAQNPSN